MTRRLPPRPVLTITRGMSIDELPALLRAGECAVLLDCSISVVYKLIRDGRLEHRKLGRLTRVPRSSLAALIDGARPADVA